MSVSADGHRAAFGWYHSARPIPILDATFQAGPATVVGLARSSINYATAKFALLLLAQEHHLVTRVRSNEGEAMRYDANSLFI